MNARASLVKKATLTLISLLVVACAHLPQPQFEPLQTFQDRMANGQPGPVMVVVPAGNFMVGSIPHSSHTPQKIQPYKTEFPQHKITIERPFAIGKFELTFREYDKFVNATGYAKPSDVGWGTKHWGRNDTPVFNINWYDAQKYLVWLSQQTGHHYRLPTEAEWEYAARAGSTTPFQFGNCIDPKQANFHGRETYSDCPVTDLYRGKVLATGTFPPNAWDLHDIHGNILEWTQDCWHDNYVDAPDDGTAWMDQGDNANCGRRVLRGGSWSGRAIDLRLALRSHNKSKHKSIFIGFRVVRELN